MVSFRVLAVGVVLLAGCGPQLTPLPEVVTPSPPARLAPTEAEALPAIPAEFEAVRAGLAEMLGMPEGRFELEVWRAVSFANACLDLPGEAETCAPGPVMGFQVIFQTPSGAVMAHVSADGKLFRMVPRPEPVQPALDSQAVAVWSRVGGIAGICQRMLVTAEGSYLLQNCGNNGLLGQGVLRGTELIYFSKLLERYAPFEWALEPPPGAGDLFLDRLVFRGTGSEAASPEVQAEIAGYLAELFDRLLNIET